MNTRLRHLVMTASIAVAATTAGCDLYFGHDYKPPPCAGIRNEGAPLAPNSLRNPQTGVCQPMDYPYPCEGDFVGDIAAAPDWGTCYTACEGLGESACLASPECFAAYIEPLTPQDAPAKANFYQCWDVAPSGPVNNHESCYGLSAQQCSRHNDCSSVYSDAVRDTDSLNLDFARCQPENAAQGCYSDQDCGPGFGCTANTECGEPPGCDLNGVCPDVCYGHCAPLGTECAPDICPQDTVCVVACPDSPNARFDESGCTIQCIPTSNSCDTVGCGPGTHCEEQCDACPPNADCSGPFTCNAVCIPNNPTSCDQIACDLGSHCELTCLAGPIAGNNGNGHSQPPTLPTPPNIDTCYATCVPNQPTSCEAMTCGPGTHCEERCFPCDPIPGDTLCGASCDVQCVPDPSPTCAAVTCAPGNACVERCNANGQCWPACVPVNPDPGSCTGNLYCFAMPPACPANTVAGIADGCWTGYCIPSNECGPNNPGTCGGNDAICAVPPPSCPTGTVAGQRNGCWSGYCIPESQCNAGVTCESLTTEAACSNRNDCITAYTGEQCTCYPDRCECQSTTFARCETAVFPFGANH